MAFLISAGLYLEAKEKKYTVNTFHPKLELNPKTVCLYPDGITSIQESEGETLSSK